MGKITSYPAATEFDSGSDVILKDGTNGTKKMTANDLRRGICKLTPAYVHRFIYRGSNIGTSVTSEQLAMIEDGSFKDFFMGDYWEINGHRYEIADIDYWRNRQDGSLESNPRHLVVIGPISASTSLAMNDTADNSGGYLGTKLYNEGLDSLRNTVRTDFGSTLLTIKRFFSSHTTDGMIDAGEFVDCTVELMNEPMLYGHRVFSKEISSASAEQNQLAVFNVRQTGLYGYSVWLCDPTYCGAGKGFCNRTTNGRPSFNASTGTSSVIPVFAIGVPS